MDLVDVSDYEKYGPLHEHFMIQARKTPEKIAVVDHDGRTITFKQLDDLTDILATYLINQKCKLGSIVGVLMERCLEWTISYIAIHKAGGAYLPIETSYPSSLIESVLEDANPDIIITKQKYLQRLNKTSVLKIQLENDWDSKCSAENKNNPTKKLPKVNLDDAAYVVYSSGTTGKPKGIICPHRGAVHAYIWRQRAEPYQEDDREACNVFFVWEMLRPLIQGIPMYIISDEVIYDPPRLTRFLADNKITRILFTPSLLETICKFKGLDIKNSFQSLRLIIFCGEVVTTSVRDQIASLCPWIKLLNLYSISETHDVSCADISNPNGIKEGRQYCSVGKALPLIHILVLDESLNEKPYGVPGDIYIAGPALAIGYLNRPDLNKLKFIKTPEVLRQTCGSRLYMTGDWGYALGDGSFEIIGRSDTMVKIRGYTVELQSIEVALREFSAVKTCTVLCVGEEGENKVLVAYVVCNRTTTSYELRSYLKTKFPFYMIPSKYFFLDCLPILKSSGKLNKKELPQFDTKAKIELDETMKPLEKKIASVWCNILGLYTIEKNENFFDVGGHSLAAALSVSQMNEEFLTDISIADLMSHPTVEMMASLIDKDTIPVSNVIDLEKDIESKTFKQIDDTVTQKIHWFWKSVRLNKNKLKNGNILLTGATGYLGVHLLQRILTISKSTVFCLLRDMPNKTPLERLKEVLHSYNITLDLNNYSDRLILLTGDLSLERFGLKDEDEYKSLSYEVDKIVHVAAFVNLLLPYSALYRANVEATKNLIEFSFLNKIKSFHYISTNEIYPRSNEILNENFRVTDFRKYSAEVSGYGQTKLVSEYLVLNAGKLGLPVSVVRCGNIGGSIEFTNWNKNDFNLYMIQAIVRSGSAPDTNWYFEITPIDFLSKCLLELFSNVTYLGKSYNFINTNPVLLRTLVSLLNSFGYNIQTLPYEQWFAKIKTVSGTQELLQLLEIKGETYLKNHKNYCKKNTEDFLKSINKTYPKIDESLLMQHIIHLANANIIPQRKNCVSQDNRKNSIYTTGSGHVNFLFENILTNKIIFVTGCSSGIGYQLVTDLVKIGATVVAVARRKDRLQKLKESLSNEAGTVIIKKLDVSIEGDVRRVVNEVISELGNIDILVNNAGVMYYTLVEKYNLDQWNNMIDVNVKGVLHCIGNILPNMIRSGRPGHIVNISSNAGVRPFQGLAVYTGTKYFIEGLSGALRQEVAENNIKITCIQAGDIETELLGNSTDQEIVEKFDISKKVPVLKTQEISQSIIFALLQPFNTAVNSILIEPPLASI